MESRVEMSSTTPTGSSSTTNTKSSNPTKDSTFRRKGAAIFGTLALSSPNPFEADESEFEDQMLWSKGEDNDEANNNTNDATPKASSSRRSVSATRMSTFRRKTAGLFSGYSANAFEDDEEDEIVSPSMGAVKQKTTALFANRPRTSNAVDTDEPEFEKPTPVRSMSRLLFQSTHRHPSGRARAGPTATLSTVSASGRIIGQQADNTVAASLSTQHLNSELTRPCASPGLSMLKRESAKLFARPANSSSNSWDEEEEDDEVMDQLTNMSFSQTQRIRGNPLKSMRGSPSLTKGTRSPMLGLEDKENVSKRLNSQSSSKSQQARRSRLISTGGSLLPFRLTRPSPLKSVSPALKPLGQAGKTPGVVGKESTPSKSVWDADDDEFEHWPSKEDLNGVVKSFTLQHGTFKGSLCSDLKAQAATPYLHAEAIPEGKEGERVDPLPIRGANLTLQEHEDFMYELADKNCGNPNGPDAHDKVMYQFYQARCKILPVSNPAGHLHLVDSKTYLDDKDKIVKQARPRLVDAVATVLYKTSPKCLADFMDSRIKVFEWRRDGNCVMIHRDGNQVIVGMFHNFGTCYVWSYFVRSTISDTGAWKDVYAGASLVTTLVSQQGVDFENFATEPVEYNVEPEDEKFALYMGRCLAVSLLTWTVWDFRTWRRWIVEWETDGVVTNAMEHSNNEIRKV
jgi:hypothetical protein